MPRLPALLAIVVGLLAFLLPPYTPIHAQSCSPRPAVGVSVTPSGPDAGKVTLTAGSGNLTRVVMVSDSQNTLIVPGGYQSAKALPHDTGTFSAPTYTFWIRPRTVGAAATVNITAYDGCGAWQTLAGTGGTPPFPTAGPTATTVPNPTATRTPVTPTVGPTQTKLATLTPVPTQTLPQLNVDRLTVEPDDFMYVSWAHVSNPDPGDKLQLFYANTQTPANGVFYVSSCKEGQINPVLAKGMGTCPIHISTGTPPGSYQFRYIRAGQSTVAAAISQALSVQTIAATNGDAQLFHLRSELEDPGVCGCVPGGTRVGYMGIEGDVSPLRTSDWIPPSIHASMIGAANRFNHDIEGRYYQGGTIGEGTLFFPSGWSEVGVMRRCVEYIREDNCGFWPFYSVGSIYNTHARLYVLDGTDQRDYLPVAYDSEQHFKTYNVGGGSWTGEWCGRSGLPGVNYNGCCPIWTQGPFCAPSNYSWVFAPFTLADGMRHVFAGQEGQKATEAIGWSRQRNLIYCCNAFPNWDVWSCEPSPPRWGRRTFVDQYESQNYVNQVLACSGPLTFIEQTTDSNPF